MAILRVRDKDGNITEIPVLEGLSAYEVAVKNGFFGSEQEWLESLRGTQTASVKTFGAIGDGVADDTAAIQAAFESEYTQIVFDPGVYKITSTITIDESTVIKAIDGNNSVILTGALGSKDALVFENKAMDIRNLHFDCQESNLKSAIRITNSDETKKDSVLLNNISVSNLTDTNTSTSTTLITIVGFKCEINECHFYNCYKQMNGSIGDGGGNLTGLWLKASGIIPASGRIHNCSFENMGNINQKGEEDYEDVSCIYVANFNENLEVIGEEETSVIIDNIVGINYGKRLIKIQSSNVHIQNVDALCTNDGSYSAVAVLGGKNITIEGVIFRGKSVLPIVSLGENTTISNCIIDGDELDFIPDDYGDYSAGIVVQKKAVINNCVIKGMQIGIAIGDSEDVFITNCNWEAPAYEITYNDKSRPTCFIFLSSNQNTKNLLVKDNTLNGYRIIFFDAYGNIEYQRDNITIENNVIYCKEAPSEKSSVRFQISRVNNVVIKNQQFFEEEVLGRITTRYLSINDCHNVIINDINVTEVNGSSGHGVVYISNPEGVVSVKNVRQTADSHKYLVWIVANNPMQSLEVEMTDPKKYVFENCGATNCPKLTMAPVILNSTTDLAPVHYMAEGMLFYAIDEAALKRVENGKYVDLISITNTLGGIENGTY